MISENEVRKRIKELEEQLNHIEGTLKSLSVSVHTEESRRTAMIAYYSIKSQLSALHYVLGDENV